MGDPVMPIELRCFFGVLDSVLRGKPLSPTTIENCAVTARKLAANAAKQATLKIDPPSGEQITRSARLFKKTKVKFVETKFSEKVYLRLLEKKEMSPKLKKKLEILLEKHPELKTPDVQRLRKMLELQNHLLKKVPNDK